MKKVLSALAVLVIAFAISAPAQTESPITISVSDLTASSLVSFSGRVEFESMPAPFQGAVKEMIKEDGTVVVANRSSKDIVAIVATIKVLAPEGIVQPIRYEHDFFFKPHAFGPNATNEIPLQRGFGTDAPQQHNDHPYVNAELLYVQFEDGTDWGDSSVAADMLAERKDVEAYLNGLKQVYETQGQEAFLAALKIPQKPQSSVGAVWRHLGILCKESGPDSAYQDIRDRLSLAETRKETGKFGP